MADSVWKNVNTPSNTAWTSSSGGTVTAWSETSGGNTLLGDYTVPGTSTATFTSVAQATTSILGTKYHLLDSKEFAFGTDNDFTFYYDNSYNSLNIKNIDSDKIFGISYKGELELSTQATLGTVDSAGKVAFSSNELYISKG